LSLQIIIGDLTATNHLVDFLTGEKVIFQPKIVDSLNEDTYFVLKAKWSFDPVAEEYRANRQKKNLEHVLNKKVMIDFKKA